MITVPLQVSPEDLKDMIRNVDTNANGAIDFNEFIEMMVKGKTPREAPHARAHSQT